MTTIEPIRGSARIELWDVVGLGLASHVKRMALYLLFVAAVAVALIWFVCASAGISPSAFWPGASDPALGYPLALMLGQLLVALVLILLFVSVLLPGFVLWRTGRERRSFTWIIDETGIKRIDALGAENLLPWSNIATVKPARRAFWLKVKPRGWRYLLRRAFTDEDQERLRQLAARMVSG